MKPSAPAPSSCCPPGSIDAPIRSKWESNAAGTYLTVGDETQVPCYYAAPGNKNEEDNENKALLVYTDIWGLQSRLPLICDQIATTGGYHVLAVDCFRGETRDDHKDDMIAWFQKTPYESVVYPDTLACFEFLKTHHHVPEDHVAALGFCWGGWALAKVSQDDRIPSWKAGMSPHPSFVVAQKAFDESDVDLMVNIACPTLLLPAGNDPDYTKPTSPDFQRLQAKQPGSLSMEFPEMAHGFTTRGDVSIPAVQRDYELAIHHMTDFLGKHL